MIAKHIWWSGVKPVIQPLRGLNWGAVAHFAHQTRKSYCNLAILVHNSIACAMFNSFDINIDCKILWSNHYIFLLLNCKIFVRQTLLYLLLEPALACGYLSLGSGQKEAIFLKWKCIMWKRKSHKLRNTRAKENCCAMNEKIFLRKVFDNKIHSMFSIYTNEKQLKRKTRPEPLSWIGQIFWKIMHFLKKKLSKSKF